MYEKTTKIAINAGLGEILVIISNSNLVLIELAENLQAAIENSTPLEVMRMLEEFNKKKLAA